MSLPPQRQISSWHRHDFVRETDFVQPRKGLDFVIL